MEQFLWEMPDRRKPSWIVWFAWFIRWPGGTFSKLEGCDSGRSGFSNGGFVVDDHHNVMQRILVAQNRSSEVLHNPTRREANWTMD
jgi:hypothetical protein